LVRSIVLEVHPVCGLILNITNKNTGKSPGILSVINSTPAIFYGNIFLACAGSKKRLKE